MALFRPADDEVGLGVISRLWIDKMNQFRCRGGKGTSWAGWSSFVHVIVAILANYVAPGEEKSCGRKARGRDGWNGWRDRAFGGLIPPFILGLLVITSCAANGQ